jgi:hypothetical protein
VLKQGYHYHLKTEKKQYRPVKINLLTEAGIISKRPSKPNAAWYGDAIYICAGDQWLYLTAFMHVCDRKLLAQHARTAQIRN